jgi:site-specific DNA recombinase
MHPDLIKEFIAEFQREMQQDRVSALSERGENERRLTKVREDIDGLLTAITDGMYHSSMMAKMDTLEAERARLEATLAAAPMPEPVALHPGLAAIYASNVSNLTEALNEDGTRAEAADLLRGLIEKVILQPDPDAPHGHRIELFGELAAILSLCSGDLATKTKARTGSAGFRQVTVVAGTGFEPVTFRL